MCVQGKKGKANEETSKGFGAVLTAQSSMEKRIKQLEAQLSKKKK